MPCPINSLFETSPIFIRLEDVIKLFELWEINKSSFPFPLLFHLPNKIKFSWTTNYFLESKHKDSKVKMDMEVIDATFV